MGARLPIYQVYNNITKLARLASVNKVCESRNTRRVWFFAVVRGRGVRGNFARLNAGISVRRRT
jgi:hypothetical protein